MGRYSGRFEYRLPGRGTAGEGACEVSFDAVSFTLVSPRGPIAFDLGDIEVFDAGEYELRLALHGGSELRLGQFAKSFPTLRHELRDAFRDRLVQCLLVSDLGERARFDGRVQLTSPRRRCDGAAEIRLYESNVAILPDLAGGFQWRLAELDAVEFDEREYAVVLVRGDERLTIGRLAKRTTELAAALRDRMRILDARSAGVLRALFPFLSAEQFRQVGAVLREGTSVGMSRMRTIHPRVERALLDTPVAPALRPYLPVLLERAGGHEWFTGFKIVRRAPGSDEETAPELERHPDAAPDGGAPGVSDAAEHAGAPASPLGDLGDGLEALVWFFTPLTDSAGTVSHVAWEAASRPGQATYVFRLPDGAGGPEAAVASLNAALVAVNFRREPVYMALDALETDARFRHYAIALRRVPELALARDAFAGRALHTAVAGWRKQLEAAVASRP